MFVGYIGEWLSVTSSSIDYGTIILRTSVTVRIYFFLFATNFLQTMNGALSTHLGFPMVLKIPAVRYHLLNIQEHYI